MTIYFGCINFQYQIRRRSQSHHMKKKKKKGSDKKKNQYMESQNLVTQGNVSFQTDSLAPLEHQGPDCLLGEDCSTLGKAQ